MFKCGVSQYWFCEVTTTIEPDDAEDKDKPLFVKWDIRKLKKIFQRADIPPIKVFVNKKIFFKHLHYIANILTHGCYVIQFHR